MAITINQQPGKFQPAYNNLIYVVSSTNVAQANFKFVFEVFVNAVSRAVLKVTPRPDNYGLFDVHRILENYITHNIELTPSVEGFQVNSNSFATIYVTVKEEYGTPPVIDGGSIVTSNTIYPYNSVFDFITYKDYVQADWVLVNGSTKKFLTNYRSNPKIDLTESAWLYLITDTISCVDHYTINKYNSSGSLLGTQNITNNYSGDGLEIFERFLRIPTGPVNINVAAGSTFIDSSVSYYTIQTFNTLEGGTTSELYRYDVGYNCTKYDLKRFHFLNKMGGFDSFTFNNISELSTDIKRNSFKQAFGDITSGTWSYSKSDQVDSIYNTVLKDKLIVNSDYLTEMQSIWLQELITSPIVYEEVSGALIPIVIIDANYKTEKKDNKKLFILTMNYNYSYDRFRQRY